MPRARVLIVDDERLVRWSLERRLEEAGYSVDSASSGEEGLRLAEERPPDVVLVDIRLPGMDGVEVLRRVRQAGAAVQVVMVTACDTVEEAIRSFKEGAFDYLIKPFDLDELAMVVEKALESSQLRREVNRIRTRQKRRFSFDRIVGRSGAIRDVLHTAKLVAETDASTVFLFGESGTGKDLVARAIHFASRRGEQAFVDINCAALPDTLLESELMGHEKGAFTDAKSQKKGLVELAHGGTLFLDEIGEMSPPLQSKLLTVIEERVFRRVGGVEDIGVDIRVIAATNRELEAAVSSGRFREDLYYRLKVMPIRLPPLRERPEDVPVLLSHFIDHFNRLYRRSVSGVTPEAARLLGAYPWPGNVRELKNVVERAIILGAEKEITAESLPPEIIGAEEPLEGYRFVMPPEGVELARVEADFLRQALAAARGNQTKAASLLGLTRDALRYRLKKFRIQS